MSENPTSQRASEPSAHDESRFPRRFLLASAATGLAAAASVAAAAPAEAASASTPWVLGGNSSVATDGSNFLGTSTAGAPIVFKTKASSTATLSEKMRLTAEGKLGLGVTKPLARVDVNSGVTAIQGVTTSTATSGHGVVGKSPSGFGVYGTSTNNYGVNGVSTNGVGVYGSGAQAGVSATGKTYGVVGSGENCGGYFSSAYAAVLAEGTEYGLKATATTTGVDGSGGAYGVKGTCTKSSGYGVYGFSGQYGVLGRNGSTAGVRGESGYVGVWGQAPTYGVYAAATGTSGNNYGLFASATSGFAVYALGNAHVSGTLSKAAGSFKIDHPLDPSNKWLSHSFVESPDMLNIYNGTITTDAGGVATVSLPSYFGALNRSFQYQLTVIGQFAQAIISREITNNTFEIKTDKPQVKVSWQVTGIRQDSYAKEHPIVVETAKDAGDRGTRQFVPKGSTAKVARYAPDAPDLSE